MPLVYSTQFINAHATALSQTRYLDEWKTASRSYLEQMIRMYGEDDFRTSTAYHHLAGV